MSGHRNTGKGLGKGLVSLMGEDAENGISTIKIREIEPNPSQPRRDFAEEELADLAQSIKENGVISPITLRKTDTGYEIIAGERRWRASRMAGMEEIPALVIEADDKRAFELAMIENLQREDLNAVEEAEGYRDLMERYGLTQENVSDKVGKSRPAIANALRLLSLPEPVIELVRLGALSMGHARALLSIKDEMALVKAAQTVIEKELSVRETEKLAKRLEEGTGKKKKAVSMTMVYLEELEHKLAQATGRKIAISQGKKRGKITIEYYGSEDLECLSDAIMKIKTENK